MEFKDTIFTNVEIFLSFSDRLRVLLGAPLHLRTESDCEVKPGHVETRSYVLVEKLFKSKKERKEKLEAI